LKRINSLENILIDEFYHEEFEKLDVSIKHIQEYTEFEQKLESFNNQLEVLNENVLDLDIDTMSIIDQAESINENKKARRELIGFILSSAVVLLLVALIGSKLNTQTLLMSQVAIMTLLSWLLIPISLFIRRGRDLL